MRISAILHCLNVTPLMFFALASFAPSSIASPHLSAQTSLTVIPFFPRHSATWMTSLPGPNARLKMPTLSPLLLAYVSPSDFIMRTYSANLDLVALSRLRKMEHPIRPMNRTERGRFNSLGLVPIKPIEYLPRAGIVDCLPADLAPFMKELYACGTDCRNGPS